MDEPAVIMLVISETVANKWEIGCLQDHIIEVETQSR